MAKAGNVLLVCALVLGVGACGGNSIVGTWTTNSSFGTSIDMTRVQSLLTTINFNGDQTVGLTATAVLLPTSPTNPGCTATEAFTGYTWSTTSSDAGVNTLTVTSMNVTGTEQRTGCTQPGDNQARHALDTSSFTNDSSSFSYSLSGNTLLLTPATGSSITFTRQ